MVDSEKVVEKIKREQDKEIEYQALMLDIAWNKCKKLEEEILKVWKLIKAESNEEIEQLKTNLNKAHEELKEREQVLEVIERDVRFYKMKLEIDKENLKPP